MTTSAETTPINKTTPATAPGTPTIVEEFATWQGCPEVPNEDTDVRNLIRIVLNECPEDKWAEKFSPAACAHLSLSAKAKKGKRAIPLPVDYSEKDIAPDHPAPPKPAEDEWSDEELIPYNFKLIERNMTVHVTTLLTMIKENKLEIPEIQRNVVWKPEKQREFIESLFSTILIFPFTLVLEPSNDNTDNPRNLLDGLQRLTAIKEFHEGNPKITLKGKRFDQLSESMQNKFLFRNLSITEAVMEREYWPLQFRLLNAGGAPLNEHEIRRASYVTVCPYLKMVDEVCASDTFVELFGGNNRYKGFGATLRALALTERGAEYSKPMRSFLDQYCKDKHLENISSKVVKANREKLTLLVNALKETLGSKAFRLEGSRANNLGLVDGMVYGGFLFMEGGVDDVKELGEHLKELRKRLLSSNIIRANLKDDTSNNQAVIERMAGVQQRAERILGKAAG